MNANPEPDTSFANSAEWLIRRFVPILIIVAVMACLSAWIRARSVFVPGIQGMIVGGIAGWIAGFLCRNDSEKYRTFSQRIWLSLSMMLIYGAAHLVFLSLCHAGVIDPPLYWLSEVANGFMKEPFVGVARRSTRSGMIEGTWWVFFNLLDFGLFAFLFLALSVVGLTRDKTADEEQDTEDSGSEDEETEIPESVAVESSRSAFHGFVLSVAAVIIAISGYWAYQHSQKGNLFSLDTLNEMKSLAGKWKLETGGEIFGKSEEARTINFEAVGYNMLRGVPEGEGLYSVSIEKRGDSFSGSVYFEDTVRKGGLPTLIRARFSPDGKTVIMVLTVWNMRGRKEVTVTGRRIGSPSANQRNSGIA